jgi:hypothetical protein
LKNPCHSNNFIIAEPLYWQRVKTRLFLLALSHNFITPQILRFETKIEQLADFLSLKSINSRRELICPQTELFLGS